MESILGAVIMEVLKLQPLFKARPLHIGVTSIFNWGICQFENLTMFCQHKRSARRLDIN